MKGKKKIFAAVLTFCLMLTGVPAVAFGEETAAAGDIVILYSSDIHGGVDSNLDWPDWRRMRTKSGRRAARSSWWMPETRSAAPCWLRQRKDAMWWKR